MTEARATELVNVCFRKLDLSFLIGKQLSLSGNELASIAGSIFAATKLTGSVCSSFRASTAWTECTSLNTQDSLNRDTVLIDDVLQVCYIRRLEFRRRNYNLLDAYTRLVPFVNIFFLFFSFNFWDTHVCYAFVAFVKYYQEEIYLKWNIVVESFCCEWCTLFKSLQRVDNIWLKSNLQF